MASVITETSTPADEHLAYALGVRRVPFAELSKKEGDEQLKGALQNIDLRELRGFKPLRELLIFSPGSVVYGGARIHTLDVEILRLKEGVTFPEGAPGDLQTHALSLCRRYVQAQAVFKRHESDEETSDWRVANEWGRYGYHARGSALSLMLRRPRNHTPAEENLLLVGIEYQKIPHEERHAITSLTAVNTSLEDLRVRFGDSFPEVAIEMLQRLKHAYWETVQELEHQLKRAKGVEAKFERLTESLTK